MCALVGQGGTCLREFSIGLAHLGLMVLCRAQLGLIWRGQSLRRLERDQLGRLGQVVLVAVLLGRGCEVLCGGVAGALRYEAMWLSGLWVGQHLC